MFPLQGYQGRSPWLVSAEAAQPTDNPDALDYILQGRAVNKPPSRDTYAERIGLFVRALALDPRSVEAQSLLALTLTGRELAGMTNTRADNIIRADELIGQALAASPRSTLAHLAKGQLLRTKRRCDEAIPEFELVIASDRNSSGALFALGACKLNTASIEETIPLEEQAIRLSPRDPFIFSRYMVIGQVHLLQSRIEEAIVWLEGARIANSRSRYPHVWLASAYALKGDLDRATAELAEAGILIEGKPYSSIATMRAGYLAVPTIRALAEATYFTGLRKAGLPEEEAWRRR